MALLDFLFGDSGADAAADATDKASERATQLQREQMRLAQAYYDPAFQQGFKTRQTLARQLGLDYTTDDPAMLIQRALARDKDRIPGNADDPLSINWTPGTGFRATPGYEFALGEGLRGVDRGASATGMLGSGARLKALQDRGMGLADQEYDDWLNRISAMAGLEQTGAGAITGAGQNFANTAGNAALQSGAARASSYLQQGQQNQQFGVGLLGDLLKGAGYGADWLWGS